MTLPIQFNQIPGAGLSAPLFAFEVNSAGQFQSVSRLLLIGHKASSGIAALDTPIPVGSQYDTDVAFGVGSMLREMVRIARQNAPVQEIWAVPIADVGTAQSWTVTINAGAAGVAGQGILKICDEPVSVQVASTDTTTQIAANLVAAINAYANALTGANLPVTATNAANVVTVTSRHLGATMAEIELFQPDSTLFSGTNMTVAAGTASTGVPSLTSVLNAIGDDAFDMIVSPFADATSIASYASLTNDVSGRWSYARQAYGHIVCCLTGSISAITTVTLALNDRHLTVIPRTTGTPHPSWLWAAGFTAQVMAWLSDYVTGNVSRNQMGKVVLGLTAPRGRPDRFPYVNRNTFINSGCSSWKGNLDGTISIDKLVTTQRTGVGGLPDITFRDIQAMMQLTHILRYMRTTLAASCGNKAIADSNPGSLGAIVTPRDIKALLVGAYDQLAQQGLVENVGAFGQAVNVVRDPSYPNRVNILMPIQRVKPLDIVAANAVLYATAIPTGA